MLYSEPVHDEFRPIIKDQVPINIPKAQIEEALSWYLGQRKIKDEYLDGQWKNDINPAFKTTPWRTDWSDTPCVRNYYGRRIDGENVPEVSYVLRWYASTLYIRISTTHFTYGNGLQQLSLERCSYDNGPGLDSRIKEVEGLIDGKYYRYISADYNGTDGDHIFWTYQKSAAQNEMIWLTKEYNRFNKIFNMGYPELKPTDPT